MDDLSEFFCEDCFFGIGQLAFEDAELEVISPVSHGSKNFTEPFWVADIVGNDVGIAHDLLRKKKIDLIVNDHANSQRMENKCFSCDRDIYGHFSENSLNNSTYVRFIRIMARSTPPHSSPTINPNPRYLPAPMAIGPILGSLNVRRR